MMSTPASRAYWTCFGAPIMFMIGIPAAWSFSTEKAGGTPQLEEQVSDISELP